MNTNVEVVPLPLELCGGVHLVCHDTGDCLKNNIKENVFQLMNNTHLKN